MASFSLARSSGVHSHKRLERFGIRDAIPPECFALRCLRTRLLVLFSDVINISVYPSSLGGCHSGGPIQLTASGQKIQVVDGLNFPWGLAADTQGNLYISEQSVQGPAHVVTEKVKSTPNGNVYTPTVVPVEGYLAASPIAVDSQGKIYIAHDDRVVVETPAGDSYLQNTLPINTMIDAGRNTAK